MSTSFAVQEGKNGFTVVEFTTPSLTGSLELEQIRADLSRLVAAEDRRKLVLDFRQVQFLSSQAIGVIMALRKELETFRHSRLALCGVGPALTQVLKITRLDKILTIKPSQGEAMEAVK